MICLDSQMKVSEQEEEEGSADPATGSDPAADIDSDPDVDQAQL